MLITDKIRYVSEMKKRVSITVEESLLKLVQAKNLSQYFNALLKEDVTMKREEPIYSAITEKLLKDEDYLPRLRKALEGAGPVKEKRGGVTYVEDSWGA